MKAMKKITHFLNFSIMKLFNTLAFAVALVAMMVVLLASCKKKMNHLAILVAFNFFILNWMKKSLTEQ